MTTETTFLSPAEKAERYGDGPWCSEPDRIEWRAPRSGYPCLILRQPEFGHWCGYVGVPPGHRLHGVDFPDPRLNLMVHGGLTYAALCPTQHSDHLICHTPAPNEPPDIWWFGFDCSHAWDLNPGLVQTLKGLGRTPLPTAIADLPDMFAHNVYRDVAYVTDETRALAKQLWSRR